MANVGKASINFVINYFDNLKALGYKFCSKFLPCLSSIGYTSKSGSVNTSTSSKYPVHILDVTSLSASLFSGLYSVAYSGQKCKYFRDGTHVPNHIICHVSFEIQSLLCICISKELSQVCTCPSSILLNALEVWSILFNLSNFKIVNGFL